MSLLEGLWRSPWCRLSLLHGQNFWDSHLSLWCPGLIQTWRNLWHFTISQRVCRSLFWNSRHDASLCEPEQHKQFCTPSKGLLCLSLVPGLLPESFAEKSVAKDEVCLGSGGTLFLFWWFFLVCSCLHGWHGDYTCKSWVILNCSLSFDKLSKIFQTWILSWWNTIRQPTCWSSSRVVVRRWASHSQLRLLRVHSPPVIFWRHAGVVLQSYVDL